MPSLPPSAENVSPAVDAALLLTAIPRLRALELRRPTATEILAATGASRSRTYELKQHLEALLPDLTRPPGRPAVVEPPPAVPAPAEITRAVLAFVYEHPGCVSAGSQRKHYSDGFRRFILELRDRHEDLVVELFAECTCIPLGTLKDWLRGGTQDVHSAPPRSPASGSARDTKHDDSRDPEIRTLLNEWQMWDGTFGDFCRHVRLDCHVPFGNTHIATILEACGARHPHRRRGRSPDEQALRHAFETFFPHAQWVGDGALVPLLLVDQEGEHLYVFNVELVVDAHSDAFLGLHVSPAEDSDAVVASFLDGVKSSKKRPLAFLLDNKPCNHTDDVKTELDDTILVRATSYRPQNKAHIEGGFGLLKPTLDGLELNASSRDELAAAFLSALVTVWARTINHRPRADRHGRTRAQLLQQEPTPEEIDRARETLRELRRKQERARQTTAARQDPIVRRLIADAYARNQLEDPEGHFLNATARYPLDAVAEGVAIFEGRKRAGTLPAEKTSPNYLLGIVRNISQEREAWEIALALWDVRVAGRDLIARQLELQRNCLAKTIQEPLDVMKAYVDRALKAPSRLDRFFWLTAASDVIKTQGDANAGFRLAARRISATHAAPPRDRATAIRFLAAKLLPLN